MRSRHLLVAGAVLLATADCGGTRKELKRYRWPQSYEGAPDGVDRGSPCTAEEATVTAVSGSSAAEVLERRAIDPATRTERTYHEAEESHDALQVWDAGKHTIIVEPYGYRLSDHAKLAALAPRGEAVSVHWGLNSSTQVSVATLGLVIRSFEAEDAPRKGMGAPLREERGLPFGSPKASVVIPASLLFLERRSGFPPAAATILDGKKPTYHWSPRR